MSPSAQAETPCPYCGRPNEIHTAATEAGARPAAGDWSVCWECGMPARYELSPLGALTVRALTLAEEVEVQTAPVIGAVLAAMRHARTPRAAAREAIRSMGEQL